MNAEVVAQRPMKDAPLWVHLLAWVSFGVVTLITVVLYYTYRETDVWAQWLGDDGPQRWPQGTETFFNERIRAASIFRTPANTFSNLSYVFVGFYVLAYALWDFRRPLGPNAAYALRKPPLMVYFGIVCIGLGVGSAYMHASITGIGGWWDILFMFGSLVGIIAIHWARWIPEIPLGAFRLPTWPLFIAIAAPLSYGLAEIHGRFSDIQIMSTLIGVIISSYLLDFKLRRTIIQHRWWIFAALSFAIAFGIWLMTNANRFTTPDGWLQGHAIWHLLTGFSLGFFAILYRTEVPQPQAQAASTPEFSVPVEAEQ